MSVGLALLRSAAGEVSEDRDRAEGSWRQRHCIYRGRRMRVESIGGLFSMCGVSCMCKQVLGMCKGGFWHVQARVLACAQLCPSAIPHNKSSFDTAFAVSPRRLLEAKSACLLLRSLKRVSAVYNWPCAKTGLVRSTIARSRVNPWQLLNVVA
jgi:hypothetical protein